MRVTITYDCPNCKPKRKAPVRRKATKREKCAIALKVLLADGPLQSKTLEQFVCRQLNVHVATYRLARKDVAVCYRTGDFGPDGRWMTRLKSKGEVAELA